MTDTVLTADLAKAIVRAGPGEYRFTVPQAKRESARDMLRRNAKAVDAQITTRTHKDTMWVIVR